MTFAYFRSIGKILSSTEMLNNSVSGGDTIAIESLIIFDGIVSYPADFFLFNSNISSFRKTPQDTARHHKTPQGNNKTPGNMTKVTYYSHVIRKNQNIVTGGCSK